MFFPFSSPSSLPPPKQERKRAQHKHRPVLPDCHNKREVRPALLATELQVLVARNKKGLFPSDRRTVWALPKSFGCFLTLLIFFLKRKLWESDNRQQKFPSEPAL